MACACEVVSRRAPRETRRACIHRPFLHVLLRASRAGARLAGDVLATRSTAVRSDGRTLFAGPTLQERCGCRRGQCVARLTTYLTTHKSVLRHVTKQILWKSSMDPKSGFGVARAYLDLPNRLEMARIVRASAVCQLGCSALLLQSGPSSGRAVASPSHCQPVGPKNSGPESDPWLTLPKCTRAESEPIKNNQKRGPSKTIKNDKNTFLFPTLAQSQGHLLPPNCSPEADHTRDCRSMFFISCSLEHGRDDCPLGVHTCGPFPDENKFKTKWNNKCHEPFLDTEVCQKETCRGSSTDIHCAVFAVAFLISTAENLELRSWDSSRLHVPELPQLDSKLRLGLFQLQSVPQLHVVPRTWVGAPARLHSN